MWRKRYNMEFSNFSGQAICQLVSLLASYLLKITYVKLSQILRYLAREGVNQMNIHFSKASIPPSSMYSNHLGAKWLVRHSIPSPVQQWRPLPSLLPDFYSKHHSDGIFRVADTKSTQLHRDYVQYNTQYINTEQVQMVKSATDL